MRKVNSDLPSSWIKTTLSEVASESKTKAEPSTFTDAPYIGLEHIEGGNNRIHSIGKATDVKSTKNVFQCGDVLYGKLRPYLKKVCRPDFDGVCSTDILVFPESSDFDNGLLLYFLSQQSTADYATQNSNGINLPRINPRTLGEIKFPLPPLAEQRRIVAKIEALQERSQRAREALAEVGLLLEQFRQSVLGAAFRGDLTADWRAAHPNVEPASELLCRIRDERRHRWEQAELAKYAAKGQKLPENWKDKYKEPEPVDDSGLQELPDGWAWTNVANLASIKHGFAFESKNFTEDGPIVLTPGNFTSDGKLDFLTKRVVRHNSDYNPEFILHKGNLVIVMTDLSPKKLILGSVAIIESEEVILHNQRIGLVETASKDIAKDFLRYALLRPAFKAYLDSSATGTLISHTSPSRILMGLVPLPPLYEQIEIVRRLDQAMKCKEVASSEVEELIAEFDQLDQSILAKAFRGELVPQDPTDEPALVLLARIQEQRAQQAEATKGKKKTATTQRRIKKEKQASKLAPQQLTLSEVL
jgi:type I restriction enzyme S subunit